jgi:hypothetical protein
MASAAQSAADRLPRRKLALRRNPLRHPPAELGSTAPPTARGRSRENRDIGKTEPIYRTKSASAMPVESQFYVGGKPIPCRRDSSATPARPQRPLR